ncbi:MAG TPA: hypothetical protein VNT52_00180 [Acidimicrobiales bacterium]|nr:hypothetical protein [Acidimicrobiales bacterium]
MTLRPEEVAGHELDAPRWLDALRRAAEEAGRAASLEATATAVVEVVCAAARWPVGRLLTVAGGGHGPGPLDHPAELPHGGRRHGQHGGRRPLRALAEELDHGGDPVPVTHRHGHRRPQTRP